MAVFRVLFLFLSQLSLLHSFLVKPLIYRSSAVDVHERINNKLSATRNRNDAFDLVDEGLIEALSQNFGIIEPNEVQNTSLPIALRGDNLLVVAQTGSGKTLSFLLPMLQRLQHRDSLVSSSTATLTSATSATSAKTSIPPSTESSHRFSALVIGPTPELLAQHAATAAKLSPRLADRILFRTPDQLLLTLGDYKDEIKNESKTETSPGANNGCNNGDLLEGIEIVAIDEVDAVLCGSEFDEAVPVASEALLSGLPAEAQRILTTAHLTRAHTLVVRELFPDIETVRQSSNARRVLVPTLRQVFHYFRGETQRDKLDKLGEVLLLGGSRGESKGAPEQPQPQQQKQQQQQEYPITMVFCKDECEVELVHSYLLESASDRAATFAPSMLHAGMPPDERALALSDFRSGKNTMLVTHELAARGLDVPSVKHVVLFDTPTDVTAFVHRAGRTARAGADGVVTCLVASSSSSSSFGHHTPLHALMDAPKLEFAKAGDLPDEDDDDDDNDNDDTR